MILLDTSILLWAVGRDHALHMPCREIIEAVAEVRLRATTTVEVIQEFAHARSRRYGREDAARLASEFAELLAPLISTDADDLAAGLDLLLQHDRLGAFDAVIAGTMSRNPHLRALVSTDRGYSDIRGVRHLNPATDDVVALASS